MNLKNYIDIILRRKWVMAVTVVVTMAIVAAGTWSITPSYKASVTLRVATASVSTTSIDYYFAERLINTYVIIATSQPLLDELDKQLNLSRPPAISVVSVPNTELITISVEDHDPNLAMDAANTLGNILITQGSEFYSGSDKTPSEILKIQVDQAQSDLNQAIINYNQLLAKTTPNPTAIVPATPNPADTVTATSNPADNAAATPNPAEIAAAGKEVDLKQQIYNTLLSQYEQLRVKEAVQANLISVVDPASFPEAPSKPNKPLYLALGLIVSLIAGFGLVLIIENLDTTLYSSEQISTVARVPMLGRIPEERHKNRRQIPFNLNSYYAEAFLMLRTALLKTIEDSSCDTLLVTSALQGEGKSTIASSLAFLMTQSTRKVVLIDCDLRLSAVHKIFDIPNELGLSEYLRDELEVEVDEIIQPTIYPGLSVITGGKSTTDPVNLLSSNRMRNLLKELVKRKYLVLLDAPATLAVTDACIVAPLVDGVLLVVKRAFLGRENMEAAIEQLTNVKAKLIGLIVNGENSSENYYRYSIYSATKKG